MSSTDARKRAPRYDMEQPTRQQRSDAILEVLKRRGLVRDGESVFADFPPTGKGKSSVQILKQQTYSS